MRGDSGFPVRVRFTKQGKVRFISHRDVARAFERAFRIETLPLAFTEGFSPRPKVSFGLALSVGHESVAEYLDGVRTEPVELDGLPAALAGALRGGIGVTGVCRLRDRAPALQEAVTAVQFRVEVTDGPAVTVPGPEFRPALATTVTRALAADSLAVTRTRKGRESTDDIRPAIRSITLEAMTPGAISPERMLFLDGDASHGAAVIELTLATQPRGARPREVLDALAAVGGIDLHDRRVLRTHQWIERAGARWEPLEADTFAPALELEARAS
jgi:radical SAM-linked protein